jgi:hypothetical protein
MANKDFKDYAIAGSNVTLTYDDINDTVTFAAQGNVQSVNGKTGVVVINKSDVSLGNVDNTSDVNKPISSATQTALDLKQTSIAGSIKTADGLAITSTLKNLSDNVGNNLPIQISTTTLRVNGNLGIDTNADSGFKLDVSGTARIGTNLTVKNVYEGFTTTTGGSGTSFLDNTSNSNYLVTGSGGKTVRLPNATTVPNGATYTFNNNQSSGSFIVENFSGTTIATIPSGGFAEITLLENSISAGTWERHEQAPSNVVWSTNTLDYPGSITSATWNGVAIADNRIASSSVWNAKQDALGFTAENVANKSTSVTTDQASDTKYPSVKALYDWAVGLFATISNLNTKTDKLITTNRQTASYTLVLGDADELVEMNVATANNLTIPLNSSVAFPIGTQILLAQYGAGQTTIVATGGVTVRSNGGKLKLNVQYSGATLIKIATNEWYLFGDIA